MRYALGSSEDQVALRFRELPTLAAGLGWCLWLNARRQPCVQCGAVVPYYTQDEGPHTRETGVHRPVVFVATGQRFPPEIPLDRVRVAPEAEVAIGGATLLALWHKGLITSPLSRDTEAAIYRAALTTGLPT